MLDSCVVNIEVWGLCFVLVFFPHWEQSVDSKVVWWLPLFLLIFPVMNIVKAIVISCHNSRSLGQHYYNCVLKTDPGIPEKDCSFQTPLEIPINVAIWRTHGFTVDPVSILCFCCYTPIMKAQLTTNSCYSAFHVPDFIQFLLQLIIFVSLFCMFHEAYHYCITFTSEKLLLLSLLNNNNHIWYLDLTETQKTQPRPCVSFTKYFWCLGKSISLKSRDCAVLQTPSMQSSGLLL